MDTSTRFVFLMHPKEFKQEKAATGRLTHLCLNNSELHMGIAFDTHEDVQALLNDLRYFPVLLYPGAKARNVSKGEFAPADLGGRQLAVLLLDATWSCARKMLKLSPSLQRLPRISISPLSTSRYVIKQQPESGCLSTLEATHELLLALEQSRLDRYPDPEQLLGLFQRMQDFQMRCAADPTKGGYRRQPYSAPTDRTPASGETARRRRFIKAAPEPGIPPLIE